MFGRAIYIPQWHAELTHVETRTDHRCNIPTLWQKGTPLFPTMSFTPPQPTQRRPIMSYVVPSRRAVTGLELLALIALPIAGAMFLAVITNIATNIITHNLDNETFNAAIPASMAGFALTLLATLKLQKWTLSDLGFHPLRHTRKYLFWQVPAIIAANFALLGLILMTPLASTGGREDIANTLNLGPIGFSLSIFAISIVAPIMEEIYYRRFIMGYLDQKLLPRMQAHTAIICSTLISSVLFALMHGVPMAMITAFFLGTCAAALIRWHQSLWASVALHIANNTVVSLVLLFIYFTGTNVLS